MCVYMRGERRPDQDRAQQDRLLHVPVVVDESLVVDGEVADELDVLALDAVHLLDDAVVHGCQRVQLVARTLLSRQVAETVQDGHVQSIRLLAVGDLVRIHQHVVVNAVGYDQQQIAAKALHGLVATPVDLASNVAQTDWILDQQVVVLAGSRDGVEEQIVGGVGEETLRDVRHLRADRRLHRALDARLRNLLRRLLPVHRGRFRPGDREGFLLRVGLLGNDVCARRSRLHWSLGCGNDLRPDVGSGHGRRKRHLQRHFGLELGDARLHLDQRLGFALRSRLR